MNWKSPVLAASSLAAILLVSCIHPKDTGTTVRNPTVADMERLEAEWGMPPKAASSGTSTATPSVGATVTGSAPSTTTTTSSTTVTQETPAATTAPAIPPSLR